jgi:hypothetical protein
MATHGKKGSRVYSIWSGMMSRCNNPNAYGYKNYGGRGIQICDKWKKFEGFYEDMGDPPDDCTLDRINNNGNYCIENCRWGTKQEQVNNRRNTLHLTAFGVTKSVSEWAQEIGVQYQTLYRRLSKTGWTPEKALTYSRYT